LISFFESNMFTSKALYLLHECNSNGWIALVYGWALPRQESRGIVRYDDEDANGPRGIGDASVYLVHGGGYLRQGVNAVDDPLTSAGVYHPLVCTHPETGRRALYLGRRRNAYIIGLPLAESEELLDKLWAHASQQRFAWYQEWKVGDLIIWDNRCAMHRRDAFDPESRRLMHRTQIKGGKPFFDPATVAA
jgi:hypothetical protein